jgi:hypothetical protein
LNKKLTSKDPLDQFRKIFWIKLFFIVDMTAIIWIVYGLYKFFVVKELQSFIWDPFTNWGLVFVIFGFWLYSIQIWIKNYNSVKNYDPKVGSEGWQGANNEIKKRWQDFSLSYALRYPVLLLILYGVAKTVWLWKFSFVIEILYLFCFLAGWSADSFWGKGRILDQILKLKE